MNALVPDVVDEAPPKDKLKVTYAADLVVKEGNELTPLQVKDEPQVSWDTPEGEEGQLHTLLMVDPDAPSRKEPKFREILHWAVVNIPGNQLSKGQTLAEYIGSGPPEGTGLHRYIFLLYRQSKGIEETLHIDKRTREGRFNFSARTFAGKHGLGKPIAGCFYEAQYDDYVPIRNKEFAG
ncbi:PREDICTED: protein D2 [Drosophila arizonae]|uniref:Protein D2 n=1 Tax=Drosophila arizonae TaxID=7263 RepID=A0ABM1NXD9_DROAR|nr:PREDICTED: protein D2 [Drosophila arizonae]XP_017859633.1 PREDICTED: protein D2 [Drosophila arizonae]XP_017859641.1 PREDICTED: protein D2 [Drosophila arizonae]